MGIGDADLWFLGEMVMMMNFAIALLALGAGLGSVGSAALADVQPTTAPMTLAQTAAIGGSSNSKASWFNCRTREVWTPEKQAWCQRVNVLKNARYEIPEVGSVQLTNGTYENQSQTLRVTLTDRPGAITFGDVNRDGVDDAVAILTVDSAETEATNYLSVVLNERTPMTPVLLGDRVDIQAIVVAAGQVQIEMVTQGPDQPSCCPTTKLTQTYTAEGDQLTLVSQEEAPLSGGAPAAQ